MTAPVLAAAAERASDMATAAQDMRGDSWNICYATDPWALIFQWRHRQAARLWACCIVKAKLPVGSALPYHADCGSRAGRSGNPSRPSNLLLRGAQAS